jgi:glycosyltransferase involved in cell wall biosynthesis
MAQHPELDFRIAYCSLNGAEPAHDTEFGATVQWDIPLLDGYEWIHLPNRGSGDQSFFGFCNPGLWKLIRDGHFDAILCYVGYLNVSFWIAFFAARLSGTAFLFGTDATTLEPLDNRSWKHTVKKILWPRLFRLADQVLALSPAGVDLMRSLSIPEDRISLIPFVVDNDWWTAQSALVDRQAVRNSWGVSERDVAVLFCAKLQYWKRPSDLLRAFAVANVSNSVLVFAGEGPLRSQLEAESAGLGIRDRVRFLGFVNQSQLPAIYTSADLFVLPSAYDACPVVVCEAMLCGCPVLLSDRICGRFDLVRPGVTGDIFPCANIDALAAALRKALGDRAHLAALSENARGRMTTFSPRENIAAALDAITRAVYHRNPARFSRTKFE